MREVSSPESTVITRAEKSNWVAGSEGVGVSSSGVSGGISEGGTSESLTSFLTEKVFTEIFAEKCGSVRVTVSVVSSEKLTYPGLHFVRFDALVTPVQKFHTQIMSVAGIEVSAKLT